MDQTTMVAQDEPVSPTVFLRDVQVMLAAGTIAVGISFLLVVGGVPMEEVDKWMLVLSAPWFALLYLVSRKWSLLMSIVRKCLRAFPNPVALFVILAIVICVGTAITCNCPGCLSGVNRPGGH